MLYLLTILQIQPQGSGMRKGRVSGSRWRPRITTMAGGMAYVTPSATTAAEVIALKVLDEPRKMHPNTITHATVQKRAYSGTSRVGWTRAKKLLKGIPRSRAKA